MSARPIGRGNTAHDDEEAAATSGGRAAIDDVRRRLADAPVVVGRTSAIHEPVVQREVDVAPTSWPAIVLFLILVGSAMAAGGIVLAGWADVGAVQAADTP